MILHGQRVLKKAVIGQRNRLYEFVRTRKRLHLGKRLYVSLCLEKLHRDCETEGSSQASPVWDRSPCADTK